MEAAKRVVPSGGWLFAFVHVVFACLFPSLPRECDFVCVRLTAG